NRLRDLAHDMAYHDFSVRQPYNPPDKPITEEPVQNLVARELEQHARSQYTVVREPEVLRKKKPDIRCLNPSCRGPVTTEVKIAERWSRAELEAAITDQLVGTYMRANNSTHGGLLV